MANITDTIKYILKRENGRMPSEGLVFAIDGTRIDVRIPGSGVVLRNVKYLGTVNHLVPGVLVQLKWDNGRPVAIGVGASTSSPVIARVLTDDDTIENSAFGIRVRKGGVRPWHLSFDPAMAGHTHMDIFRAAGWRVDEDGTIYQSSTFLHPDGQISLGVSPDIIKLDAEHATHRLWVGNVEPLLANFSVTKEGDMTANSGSIAGWDILADRLSKNDAEILSEGQITLGTGDDIAILSAINEDGWRLWIGNADPELAPFRVDLGGQVWLSNAHIWGDMESSNYVSNQQGWHIDEEGWAEFNNVNIRGKITATVFERSTVSAISGRAVIAEAAVLSSDVGSGDTEITVDTSAFGKDDVIQIQTATENEWMRIVDAGTGTADGYVYAVERDLAGTGAGTFYKGEVVVSRGMASVPGAADAIGSFDAGFGEVGFAGGSSSAVGGFLTLEGSRQYGPYFGVARRFGPDYNQIVDIARFGRLEDFLTVEAAEYGIAIGDTNRHFIYTYNSGLQLKTAAGSTIIDDDGIVTGKFALTPETPAYVDGYGYLYLDATFGLHLKYKDGATESDEVIGGGVTDDHKTGFHYAIMGDVSISFSDGDMEFTIEPTGDSFEYYYQGVRYTVTDAQTVAITDTEGIWYIFFVGDTLTASQDPWEFDNTKVFVSQLYWDAANNTHLRLQYELHTWEMDDRTHHILHDTFGTRWATGLEVTKSTVYLNVTEGEIFDEDIEIEIIDDDTPDSFFEQPLTYLSAPILYRSGASAWRKVAASTTPCYLSSNVVQYNSYSAPNWGLSGLSGVGKYCVYWVIASTDIEEPIILIPGQAESGTLAACRDANQWNNMNFGTLPMSEYKVLARVIIQRVAGSPYYSVEEVLDYRSAADHIIVQSTNIDHGSLSGLLDDDHTQYMQESVYDADGDGIVDNAEALGGTTPSVFGLSLIDDADAATARDTLQAGIQTAATGTLADDAAYSFTPNYTYGWMTIIGTTSAAAAYFADVLFRVGASGFVQAIAIGTNVAVTTGALTGTTGTDGKLTISSHTDGKIYIENRTASSRSWRIVVLGYYAD